MIHMRNLFVLALLIATSIATARANVITDWDATAVSIIQGNAPAPPPTIGPVGGVRIMTILHIATFEAVNAIDPKYESYLGPVKPGVRASEDAAAAAGRCYPSWIRKMQPK